MMFEVLLLPLIAGVLVAMVAGPLGSFTVWRGMAYFGDTLAHSALMGVAAALIFDFNVQLGIILCGITISLLLIALQRRSTMSIDSLLGILSHASLAVGLVAVSLVPGNRVDLFSYLFGDLLTVTLQDILFMLVLCVGCLLVIIHQWPSLLMLAIDEELAQAEGKRVELLRLLLMILMALVIAVAMKTVGILLITALLIIPAASAQKVTRSPEAMALAASLIGIIAVCSGLLMSATVDTPTGPSIVICSAVIFMLTVFKSRLTITAS